MLLSYLEVGKEPILTWVMKSFKSWSKKKVISELRSISKQIGRPPKRNELRSMGYYDLSRAAERHFKGWNNALLESGLYLHRKNDWTRQECLKRIKKYQKKLVIRRA
jgi:hypothetical protein